jgi:hypothetical protein
MTSLQVWTVRILSVWLLSVTAFAQDNLEDFRVEFTGYYWRVNVQGTVTAGSAPVDLVNDLGIRKPASSFAGRLVFRVGGRHRIVIAGVPYRFKGTNRLTREVEFAGRRYSVSESITSRAEINQIFGGYQYDIAGSPKGHLGVVFGANYLDAFASARSTNRDISETSQARIPIPVIGFEGRRFVSEGMLPINVNGEIKGMNLGKYGRYVEAQGNIALGLGSIVALQFGYALLDADIRRDSTGDAFTPTFRGPTVSLQLRSR